MNRIFKKTASFLFLLGMAISVFFACQSGDESYYEYPAIASALQHYDQKGDPRQLKAAEFLINGMSIRQSPQKDLLNTTYFSMADSLSGQYPHGLPREIKANIIDSLLSHTPSTGQMTWNNDLQNLSSSYLIENIDEAFKGWQNAPWKDQVSFEDFCEYVLPYSIRKEVPEEWRSTLRKSNQQLLDSIPSLASDSLFYAHHRQHTYRKIRNFKPFFSLFPYDQNYRQMAISRTGECIDQCAYTIYHLRAAGIPAALDFVPNWGNRPNSHFMVGQAHKNQQFFPIASNFNSPDIQSRAENAAMPGKMNPLLSKSEMPEGLYVQFIKTIPKVYRYTWSIQNDQVRKFEDVPKEEIHTSLAQPNIIDVSEQYIETATVDVQIPADFEGKMAYLAVFDRNGWKPVSAERITGNHVTFSKMGKNILYLPVGMTANRTVPLGDPFVVNNDAEKTVLSPDHDSPKKLTLIRKFPLFSYTAEKVLGWKGTTFEASNTLDFAQPTTLASIDHYPFYWNSTRVKEPKAFRYLRFTPSRERKTFIGEIEYYGLSKGDTVKLKGEIIHHDESVRSNQLHVFDNDMNSHYTCLTQEDQITVDLGPKNQIPIVKIRYCPRNDTNCIIKGLRYELLYWDGKWVSAGTKLAQQDRITFDDIPSNTIYWLKCLDQGKEERPFTYPNNQQIWW